MRPFALAAMPLLALIGLAPAQPPAPDVHGDPLPAGAAARLGTVRFRHANPIVFAAFTPDGKRVVSLCKDGVVCIWEFPSGKRLARLELLTGTAAQATGATLSPDGKHLSAFVDDGLLRIWDLEGGRELGKVAVGGLAPDAAPPALAKTLLTRAPAGPTFTPVYSPDGKTLLLASSSRVLQLVNLPTGKEVVPNFGHLSPLTAIWFTPDGTRVFTKDAKVTHAWNVANGKNLGASGSAIQLPPSPGSPTILSPDGRLGITVARFATPAAARGAKFREAYLFDPATGKQLGIIELEVEYSPMHRRPLVFAPDGKLLAAVAGEGAQKIDLYDPTTGKLLRSLDTGVAPPAGGKGFAKGGMFASANQKLLFSGDGKALAFQGGPGETIVILDVERGRRLASLPNPEGRTLQGMFTPDGRCLTLEAGSGVVALYELATGQLRRNYGKVFPGEKAEPAEEAPPFGFKTAVVEKVRPGCAISPEGSLLALPGAEGAVHVLDVVTGKELALLKGHTAAVHALAFSPDGKLLASASADTTALLWDMRAIARPAPGSKALTPADLETLWNTLAEPDGKKSFAAIGDLAAGGKAAAAWLGERVRPADPLDAKRVETLLKQLGDSNFKVRATATEEVAKLGEAMLPFLEKALAAMPSLEAERRLRELKDKLDVEGLSGESLRVFRAIEALERMGTKEAREVLERLASGAPGALVTRTARRALGR